MTFCGTPSPIEGKNVLVYAIYLTVAPTPRGTPNILPLSEIIVAHLSVRGSGAQGSGGDAVPPSDSNLLREKRN